MSTLSIRGLDSHLAAQLKKTAYAEQKSVNQFVLDILKQQLGLTKQKKFTQHFDDLDHLFGGWNNAEYQQITDKIISEKQIDDELWQ